MEQEIYIPLLSWLIGASRIGGKYNVYVGSYGTDPMLGCIGRKVFNYRIWIEKPDEQEFIKAAVYYGMNCYECQNEDEIETATFEMEEESRALIENWLKEKRSLYFAE